MARNLRLTSSSTSLRPRQHASKSTGTAKRPVSTRSLGREIRAQMIRLDDDHIETTIFTRSLNGSMSDTEDAFASRAHSPSAEEDDDEGHGKTTDGAVACCRQYSDGQVNCGSCLNTALKAWAVESSTNEQEVSRHVLDALDEAGPAGLHISTLIVSAHLASSVMTILVINTIRQTLWEEAVPKLF